jgi:hypothetical protein
MNYKSKKRISLLSSLVLIAAICTFFADVVSAQTTTAGGTVISNQASAIYSDGLRSYSALSNIVTVTVSEVAGLAITPDAGTNPVVVPGQTNNDYIFTVTNAGNSNNNVTFLANGASMTVTGPGTITAAVIDVDGSNTINAGDTNIFTNPSVVTSASLAQNASIKVIVRVNVNANATVGQTVQVTLGDATNAPTYDNQTANNSAHEVATTSTTAVNGKIEARGDITATVQTDAQIQVTLTAPAGPIVVGANIPYSVRASNPGLRTLTPITLANAPAGSNSGIFIIAPIPVQTTLATGQSFPAGTLYSVTPLTTDPLQAVWTTTPPADLTTVTRIAFNGGASLAVGAQTSNFPYQVKVNDNANASNPIAEIVDAFGTNSVGVTITDQSGDNVANYGDGNANFNEGNDPGNVDGNGIQQLTTLGGSGGVLNGPALFPGAVGPNNNNDDYTNLSTNNGIYVPFGGVTTQTDAVVFTNSVINTGSLNDVFRLTATVPAGVTVEISKDLGLTYTNVTSGGFVDLPVLFNLTGTYNVRVTVPAGQPVLTAYDVVIRATSAATPGVHNDTIDRVYTGFVRLDKTVTVTNSTGVGGPNDPVPGAVLTYDIKYTNISSTGGDINNKRLVATGISIVEDGNAAPNNWGTTTNQVVGSGFASTPNGVASVTVGADILGSTLVSHNVALMALTPGEFGTFSFKRVIK